MSSLPEGTVTFVFTDLEGSTRLWEEHPEGMLDALARHDEILRFAVEAHAGQVVKTTGDGVHATFATAHDAVAAAVDAQRALTAEVWQLPEPLRVRVGVHTCEAQVRDGDYYGSEVNRAARLMSLAHGGQILVSLATSALVRDRSVELVDLGEHHLRDLTHAERVFQVQAPGLASAFPPLRSVDASPGNLPRQVTSFVGREPEIAAVAELVRQGSLVTLTGVGGVGKTRLALQVAGEVVPHFPDGAWVCELAPISDQGAVLEALAATLRVPAFPGRSLEESLLDYLAAKRLLLVLDNCEHLLVAVARQVDVILQRCAQVVVLATSREGLGVAGERIVAVPSLDVPAGDAPVDDLLHADAVRLFADRAHAANHNFVLTDENALVVGVLCRRLDGIPLAIELAAARVRSMAPDDLVARLDQRFKLLTRGSRAALERHQTLRATIDWSYDLLGPTERDVFDRMSVFAGGCDLAAAEHVLSDDTLDTPDIDDLLGHLVDKSLVVADTTHHGVRYRSLETIRQYAAERLEASGGAAGVRRRHAEHYVAFAEAAGRGLRSRDQLEWAPRCERETDNLRAVLDWAVEHDQVDTALRLVAPLAVNGMAVGYTAMDWAETAMAIPGSDDHPLAARVAAWAGWGAVMRADYDAAVRFVERARTAEERRATHDPEPCQAPATLALFTGNVHEAARHADEWVARARSTGTAYDLTNALVMQASTRQIDHPEEAITIAEEAVRAGRAAGLASATSNALMFLAGMLWDRDFDRSFEILDEALRRAREIGDRMTTSQVPFLQGWTYAQLGEWHAALEFAADAASQKLALGDAHFFAASCGLAAVALARLGRLEPAAVLLGAAGPEVEFAPEVVRASRARAKQATLDGLGEDRVAELARQGAALDSTALVGLIRSEASRLSGHRSPTTDT